MRIAYVCADRGVPIFGNKGCSIHVREVISALLRRGSKVELFAARLDGNPPADWKDVCIHPLPILSSTDSAEREQLALAGNDQVLAALKAAGNFDLVYERYSLWSYAGMEYASLSSTPGILEVNAPLIQEQAEHRVLLDHAAAQAVATRVFCAADALIAVSHEIASYLSAYPAARGRIHVIPNGVNPARFPENLQATLATSEGAFIVGFVGSMKPWHGLPLLIEAFKKHHTAAPDSRLLIVGDGKAMMELQASLKDTAIARSIILTGSVSSEEIPGLLASMSVAVAPYPPLSNFYFSPLKVYEYMAAARPVIASRIGSLSELIQHEVNGLLCPPGDIDAMAAAILQLKNNPALGQHLGAAARKTVLASHTWDEVARRTLSLVSCQRRRQELPMEAAS